MSDVENECQWCGLSMSTPSGCAPHDDAVDCRNALVARVAHLEAQLDSILADLHASRDGLHLIAMRVLHAKDPARTGEPTATVIVGRGNADDDG